MPWNDDNVARLRDLWDQGLPTAQIGKLLDFTKNAVVGKAHRIGLERRPSPIRRTAVKPDRKKARSPVMPKLNFENNQNQNIVNLNGSGNFQSIIKNPFSTNKKRGCEWPIGHPNEQDFCFCDKERFYDKPYCFEHCTIAYVLPEKEEDQKNTTQIIA
jgi:GcrA cell cycle regulator